MATKIRNGVRIEMSAQEEAQWLAHLAARPAPPPSPVPLEERFERFLDLMVAKGNITDQERV